MIRLYMLVKSGEPLDEEDREKIMALCMYTLMLLETLLDTYVNWLQRIGPHTKIAKVIKKIIERDVGR